MYRSKSELEVKGQLNVIENYTGRMKLHLCGADHTEIIPAVLNCKWICCTALSGGEYSDPVISAPSYTLAVNHRPSIHHDVSPSLTHLV